MLLMRYDRDDYDSSIIDVILMGFREFIFDWGCTVVKPAVNHIHLCLSENERTTDKTRFGFRTFLFPTSLLSF